jgi:hypothetical protein
MSTQNPDSISGEITVSQLKQEFLASLTPEQRETFEEIFQTAIHSYREEIRATKANLAQAELRLREISNRSISQSRSL